MNNLDWQHQTHIRARYIFEQLSEMLKSAPNEEEKKKFLNDPNNYYLNQLNNLYTDEFQLAVLMDRSDIMFHAQGESATHDSPSLSAVNWLTSKAQENFRKISKSYLSKYMTKKDGKVTSESINFRFNGYAPGSIYLGFSIEALLQEDDFLKETFTPIDAIRDIIKSISDIPNYIVNGHVDKKAILEIIDDPAMRDTVLQVSHSLSPDGKGGIDSLSVANSDRRKGTFTQVTKRLFKEAISNPLSSSKSTGSFIGEVREIDLDKERFELRGIQGIGSVRCTKPKDKSARSIIGEYIKVTGEYENDKDGKPSLMRVDDIEILTPEQKDIKF